MHIRIADLIAEVRRLAQDNPDFVYPTNKRHEGPSCVYNPEEGIYGRPACIFGQAFINLGSPVDEDPKLGAGSIECVCTKKGIQFNSFQGAWISAVQRNQDSGIAWGAALDKADKHLAWWLGGEEPM